jgi:predicted lipid-binding transport protein (Tim44 family)
MQGSSWIPVLAKVPPDQTDNLLFITNNGTSIAVKGIVRAESEYVIVRGRLMGSAEEGGGFFFVPFDQINYVGFQRQIKETVIQAMYEGQPAASLAAAAAPTTADAKPAEVAPTPSPAQTPTPPPVTAPAAGSVHPPGSTPGKAALLERLRARRASSDMPKT